MFQKCLKTPRVNKKPQIEERQTTQWPKEKGQKDKQRSTKHYTENKRLSNANPIKTWGELMCSESVSRSCSTNGTLRVTLLVISLLFDII